MGLEQQETRVAIGRLRDAIATSVSLTRVTEGGVVQAVARDSNGRAYEASVRIGDGQDVTVALDGRAVRAGDAIEISRSKGAAAAPDWRMERYLSSLSPFPVLDDDATIPAPIWLSSPLVSTVVAPNPGSQHAVIRAHLRETPERFSPQYTEIQWRLDSEPADAWASMMVGNVGGQDAELDVTLAAAFPSAVSVSVRARSVTNSGARSLWSDVRTIMTATSTLVPTAPTAFSVDLTVPLTAIITLPPPAQPHLFDRWEISIATSSGGSEAQTYQARGSQFVYQTATAGDIYLRIREVTRAGVPSDWYPAATWQGPYTIQSDGGIYDTTPPAVPTIASATSSQELIQGNAQVVLTVTLAFYSAPADFAYFEYRFQITDGAAIYHEIWSTTQPFFRRYDARPGALHQIEVRAFDASGNGSAWSSPAFVTTDTITTPPTPGGPPTLTAYFKGALVSWTATPDSPTYGRITGYQVQRAPDNSGSPGTWATVAHVDLTRWVDAALGVATVYHYRYRPLNASGTPAASWSPHATVTTLAVENGDIAANAVTANTIAAGAITAVKLESTLILATEIRAQNPGRISAGNGNVMSDDLGSTFNGAAAIRFTNEAAYDWTNMRLSANLRGQIDVIEHWHGYAGRGVHIIAKAAGATDEPGVYIEGQRAFVTDFYAAKVTGQRIQFLRWQNAGAVVKGWEFHYGGIRRPDDSAGVVLTMLDTPVISAWNTTSAGVDGIRDYATLGIPASCHAVKVRYTFSAATGVRVYLHAGGASAPERGLFAEGIGSALSVTIDGDVPVEDAALGQIRLLSTGGTISNGILVVLGYYR